jgi:hypothetical protein
MLVASPRWLNIGEAGQGIAASFVGPQNAPQPVMVRLGTGNKKRAVLCALRAPHVREPVLNIGLRGTVAHGERAYALDSDDGTPPVEEADGTVVARARS